MLKVLVKEPGGEAVVVVNKVIFPHWKSEVPAVLGRGITHSAGCGVLVAGLVYKTSSPVRGTTERSTLGGCFRQATEMVAGGSPDTPLCSRAL